MTILAAPRRITKSKWVTVVDTEKIEEVVAWCKTNFGESCRNPKRGRWRVGWVEVQKSRTLHNNPYSREGKGIRIFLYHEEDVSLFTLKFS